MLEANGLACERGGRRLFSGLAFTLNPGDVLRIAGANGSGKTSLLRIVCGLLPPAAGEVRWQGRAIGELVEDYARALCYIGHLNGMKDEFSSLENLRIAAELSGFTPAGDELIAALACFGLAAQAHVPLRRLSQGQRRRAALARLALPCIAPLWILDEPFNTLDVASTQMLARRIDAHAAAGGSVVLTTHFDLPLLSRDVRTLDLHVHAGHA